MAVVPLKRNDGDLFADAEVLDASGDRGPGPDQWYGWRALRLWCAGASPVQRYFIVDTGFAELASEAFARISQIELGDDVPISTFVMCSTVVTYVDGGGSGMDRAIERLWSGIGG